MKTMHQIRQMLCEEIDALRAKTTTPANVNAIVNATGKILTTVKMEMEYAKLMNKQPDLQFMALGIADTAASDCVDAPEAFLKQSENGRVRNE